MTAKKAENENSGPKGKTEAKKRLSDKQKKNRLEKYHRLIAAGTPALKAAKKVGVSYVTLLNWEKQTGLKKPNKPALKGPAQKKAPRAGRKAAKRAAKKAWAGGLAIVTPEGVRIEGLSTADLVRVLKALK